MNPDVKEKWVAALRSGEYRQAQEYLRVDRTEGSEYCCLGVLCDLFRQETGKGKWEETPSSFKCVPNFQIGSEESRYTPPSEVWDWAGMQGESDTIGLLMRMNDGGSSFQDIAQKIEEKL